MATTFSFTVGKGYTISQKVMDLTGQRDFMRYMDENIGKELHIELEELIQRGEKSRMYRYLNGPLLNAVRGAMRNAGNPYDKAKAMLEMKLMFAKDIHVDRNDNSHVIIMSQSDMTKDRLLQFMQDIIFHLESEYGVEAPDSEKYKLKSLDSNGN